MPISLGPPTTNPKWRGWILTLLWLSQLFITIFLFFGSLAMTLVIGGTGAHKEIPWYFTATTILSLIANTILLFTILYELTYTCALPFLSATRFYRMQLVKSLYFLLLVILVSVNGSGWTAGGASVGAWGAVWRGGVVVGPFWLALVYAVIARRKVERQFGDEEGMGLRMLW
ncbi:hypothetical protein BKA61DRAFT_708908 [Leptodontidium sp. MPI-SDFR-AT-0119]|nr:hypothetical protein BKA61DRAFT_708908 [Leptodontidium sp. MPI-SDFR-AT-0119]